MLYTLYRVTKYKQPTYGLNDGKSNLRNLVLNLQFLANKI